MPALSKPRFFSYFSGMHRFYILVYPLLVYVSGTEPGEVCRK